MELIRNKLQKKEKSVGRKKEGSLHASLSCVHPIWSWRPHNLPPPFNLRHLCHIKRCCQGNLSTCYWWARGGRHTDASDWTGPKKREGVGGEGVWGIMLWAWKENKTTGVYKKSYSLWVTKKGVFSLQTLNSTSGTELNFRKLQLWWSREWDYFKYSKYHT